MQFKLTTKDEFQKNQFRKMNLPWRQTQWRQRQWRHLRHCVRNEKKIVCEGVVGRQAKHEDKSLDVP